MVAGGGGAGAGGDGGGDGGWEGIKIRQMIGIVDNGYWDGDGFSSGLMGLAYPVMVSGYEDLEYTSVMFSV